MPSRPTPSLPTPRALLGFAARFVVLYAAIFGLAWWGSLFQRADAFVVAGAARQLAALDGPQVTREIVLEDNGDIVQYVTMPRVRRARLATRGGGHVSHNGFLFLALVLASPGLVWRQRLVALAVGGAVILCLDVLVVIGMIWQADLRYLSGIHPGIATGPLAQLSYLASALHPTGGLFMAPVFLWGFTLLALPGLAQRPPQPAVGRNEPCPCGSGRKFKLCCGRQAP